MDEKERLLALLDNMGEIIADAEDVEETGKSWRILDYDMRKSIAAGKLCEAVFTIDRAEAITKSRPGTLAAIIARHQARKARRKQERLEQIITEPIEEYHPAEPSYDIRMPKRKYQRKDNRFSIWTDHHRPMFILTGPEPEPNPEE